MNLSVEEEEDSAEEGPWNLRLYSLWSSLQSRAFQANVFVSWLACVAFIVLVYVTHGGGEEFIRYPNSERLFSAVSRQNFAN